MDGRKTLEPILSMNYASKLDSNDIREQRIVSSVQKCNKNSSFYIFYVSKTDLKSITSYPPKWTAFLYLIFKFFGFVHGHFIISICPSYWYVHMKRSNEWYFWSSSHRERLFSASTPSVIMLSLISASSIVCNVKL